MYGKCGCLLEACKVLDELPNNNVVSWNSMVYEYTKNARFREALEVGEGVVKGKTSCWYDG